MRKHEKLLKIWSSWKVSISCKIGIQHEKPFVQVLWKICFLFLTNIFGHQRIIIFSSSGSVGSTGTNTKETKQAILSKVESNFDKGQGILGEDTAQHRVGILKLLKQGANSMSFRLLERWTI